MGNGHCEDDCNGRADAASPHGDDSTLQKACPSSETGDESEEERPCSTLPSELQRFVELERTEHYYKLVESGIENEALAAALDGIIASKWLGSEHLANRRVVDALVGAHDSASVFFAVAQLAAKLEATSETTMLAISDKTSYVVSFLKAKTKEYERRSEALPPSEHLSSFEARQSFPQNSWHCSARQSSGNYERPWTKCAASTVAIRYGPDPARTRCLLSRTGFPLQVLIHTVRTPDAQCIIDI